MSTTAETTSLRGNDLTGRFTRNSPVSRRQHEAARAQAIIQAAAALKAKRLDAYRWEIQGVIIGTRRLLKLARAKSLRPTTVEGKL